MGERNGDWRERLVGFDFEVTAQDWLLVVKNHPSGETLGVFHNDCSGLIDFIDDNNYIYVGYNNKHYDNYILKGVLNNYSPDMIKDINDYIIVQRQDGWTYPYDDKWVKLPPTSDLMLDMPLGQSLKELEGNMLMDIQESTISFNITHKWSEEEYKEMLHYCEHDVLSTVKLIDERMGYLEAKVMLGEMCGVSVEESLYKTNAQLCAISLGAKREERSDEQDYQYPSSVDFDLLPIEVKQFFDKFKQAKEVKGMKLELDVADVPHTFALGGLHGALPNYIEETNDDRIILMSDIASYYPALMINYDYLSRNVQDRTIYRQYRDDRVSYKKTDKKKANALKLVLNTTYGAMLNQYNDLFDPLMGRSVCITGQILITNLVVALYNDISSFKLAQTNTDGIIYSIDRSDYDHVMNIIDRWCDVTGFDMEHNVVNKMIQKDVNNYCMEYIENDEVHTKVKGGYVSDYKPSFRHNSLSIVSKAIVDHLLHGKDVDETINACNDIFKFQMICKTGSSYDKTVHYVDDEEHIVQKANRVYATNDNRYGIIRKVKRINLLVDEDGERRYYINLKGNRTYKKNWDTDEQGDYVMKLDKTQNCPLHAIIDNSNKLTIDTINKEWYSNIAKERINDFLGKQKTKTKKERKQMPAQKQDEVVQTFEKANLYKKIFELGNFLAKQPYISDGYNSQQGYEYIKSHYYREVLGKGCREVGLIFKFNINQRANEVVETKNSKMNMISLLGNMVFIDPQTGEFEQYMVWADGTDNLDKGLFKAETMAIKYFVLNNFLLPQQQDEIDPEDGSSEKQTNVSVKSETTKKKEPIKQATPQEREEAKVEVVDDVNVAQSYVDEMISLMNKIREKSSGYGEKTYQNLIKVKTGEMTLTKIEAVKKMTKIEEKADELGID